MPESVSITLINTTGGPLTIQEGADWTFSVLGGTGVGSPYRTKGQLSVPAAGNVELMFDSDVMWSFESGQIRTLVTAGSFTYTLASTIAGAGILRVPVAVAPGDTIREWFWFPTDITVTSLQVMMVEAAITAGTYTAYVYANVGPTIIGATSLTALTDETILSMPTGTLDLDANALGYIEVASNNADLTGSGLYIQITYVTR